MPAIHTTAATVGFVLTFLHILRRSQTLLLRCAAAAWRGIAGPRCKGGGHRCSSMDEDALAVLLGDAEFEPSATLVNGAESKELTGEPSFFQSWQSRAINSIPPNLRECI